MRKMAVDKLEEGMKIAKPVTNDNGIVLLPEGAEVNAVMIARLQKWKIDVVFIEGDDADEMAQLQKIMAEGAGEMDEKISARLESRFTGHEGNELMQGIKMVALGHIKKREEQERLRQAQEQLEEQNEQGQSE